MLEKYTYDQLREKFGRTDNPDPAITTANGMLEDDEDGSREGQRTRGEGAPGGRRGGKTSPARAGSCATARKISSGATKLSVDNPQDDLLRTAISRKATVITVIHEKPWVTNDDEACTESRLYTRRNVELVALSSTAANKDITGLSGGDLPRGRARSEESRRTEDEQKQDLGKLKSVDRSDMLLADPKDTPVLAVPEENRLRAARLADGAKQRADQEERRARLETFSIEDLSEFLLRNPRDTLVKKVLEEKHAEQ